MGIRHRGFWVALSAAVLSAGWSGAAPLAGAETGGHPTVALSESLGDGRILTRFTNGVTVVATQGTRVVFETVPSSGREGGLAVGLIPPDYDEAGAARAARAYRAAGRSPEKDERALGYSRADAKAEAKANRQAPKSSKRTNRTSEPKGASTSRPGEIYDTGCAKVDGSVFWKGCYRRYYTADNDPNSWYAADESQASGHGKGWWYLRTGRTDHRYSRAAQVVQWEPANDVPAGRCEQRSFSLGAYGVSMSRTTSVCPERISINTNSDNRFFAQWNGAVRADNPGVVAQNFARVPAAKSSGFEYWVYEYHTVYA